MCDSYNTQIVLNLEYYASFESHYTITVHGIETPDPIQCIEPKNSTSPDSEDVKEEKNERLLCNVCMSNDKNVFFGSCKHISVCHECLKQLTKCPVCRQPISQNNCKQIIIT
jgi:NAD-dependent SIR2 family protein deacetylase